MPIKIKELTKEDLGREVKYTAFEEQEEVEFGRITGWNDKVVFVRYHLRITNGEEHPRYGETSEGTDPDDLEFTTTTK